MAVTKRIFQMAKEFECDEKEIMNFLAKQGVKVSNRLSAVNEETYNMLKEKFMAPPPAPEPEPEPEPEVKEVTPAETPAELTEQPQPAPSGKKKKKKNKQPQPAEQNSEQAEQAQEPPPMKVVSEEKVANMGKRTQTALFEGIMAGNEFIQHYTQDFGSVVESDGKNKPKPLLSWNMDTWGILYNMKFDYPDSSPVRYWQSVAKLMTRAFKLLNAFGVKNKESLAKMRDAMSEIGKKYQPREIFTDEENQKFAEQQQLLFETFGHGMGLVNDNLYDLKL
ncbi:MAG: translation initiation factor IF-2 N-terminal domain-containing protein, partial [Selenomonadaceae bacterium]|nr:translation initiation factor IF-2 N-terminal domain-containing protein [Selenomonadaceae bacterium]